MSRRVASILNKPEKEIAEHLASLEEHNGFPSHDARYIADNHQTLRRKLLELQLDPDDTTAEELFLCLQVKFEADSQKINQFYKAEGKDFAERAVLASKLIEKTLDLPKLWVLKASAAKKMMRQQPPKHVMKTLGYRSVDSILKRENITKLYVMAGLLESERWQKSLERDASKLVASSFETRQLSLIVLNGAAEMTDKPLISSDLTGALAIVGDSPLLAMLISLTEALSEHGVDANRIYKLNETISWWAETDNLVATLEDGQVSMNIRDVAASWLAGHGFEDRQIEHSRRSYWKNLLEKYENKAHLEEAFDDSVMSRVRKLNFKGPQPAFEFEYAEDL